LVKENLVIGHWANKSFVGKWMRNKLPQDYETCIFGSLSFILVKSR